MTRITRWSHVLWYSLLCGVNIEATAHCFHHKNLGCRFSVHLGGDAEADPVHTGEIISPVTSLWDPSGGVDGSSQRVECLGFPAQTAVSATLTWISG